MRARLGVVLAVLALSLQAALGQDLNGCSSTKGCFSRGCPCNDCSAFVTWEVDNGRMKFSLKAERPAGLAWVAVGFRPSNFTEGMVPADVYACTSSSNQVERSENTLTPAGGVNSVNRTPPPNTVTTESVSSEDNVITCTFTRDMNFNGDDMFYDISGDNDYYLLLAVGQNVNPDGTISGNIHVADWVSPDPVKLQSDFLPATQAPVGTPPPLPGFEGCGSSRGCFSKTCSDNTCNAFVMWETTASGATRFTLQAERVDGLEWVAFGIRPSSSTHKMVPADVYYCVRRRTFIQRSENTATDGTFDSIESEIPNNAILLETFCSGDNMVTCSFIRQPSVVGNDKFYSIDGQDKYYVLLAVGTSLGNRGRIAGTGHIGAWSTPEAYRLQQDFPAATEPPPLPTQSPVTLEPGSNECGKTVGCFQPPTGCGGECTVSVMYRELEDGQIRFTLRGQRSGGISWVAVGLRQSTITSGMSPADVYACTSGSTEVLWSENVGTNSETRTLPSGAVSADKVEIKDNEIMCTFTRQASIKNDDKFYNVSSGNSYYLLLAVGDEINADGTIQNHFHVSMWASPKARDLTEFSLDTGDARNIALAKAHASLMVIAWLGFASIGLVMARYFKPMWPSSKIAGNKVWFVIHRTCMQTCAVVFSVAFILIFVYLKGFVNKRNKVAVAHAICGIIATFLGLLNPVMALIRPHPKSKRRFLFNWCHRAVGVTAYLIALTTVFLGIGYGIPLLSDLEESLFYAMIAFLVFDLVIFIGFEIHLQLIENKGSQFALPKETQASSRSDIQMKSADAIGSNQMPESAKPELPAGAQAKLILLGVCILGLAVFTIVFIVYIAIA